MNSAIKICGTGTTMLLPISLQPCVSMIKPAAAHAIIPAPTISISIQWCFSHCSDRKIETTTKRGIVTTEKKAGQKY